MRKGGWALGGGGGRDRAELCTAPRPIPTPVCLLHSRLHPHVYHWCTSCMPLAPLPMWPWYSLCINALIATALPPSVHYCAPMRNTEESILSNRALHIQSATIPITTWLQSSRSAPHGQVRCLCSTTRNELPTAQRKGKGGLIGHLNEIPVFFMSASSLPLVPLVVKASRRQVCVEKLKQHCTGLSASGW